MTSTRGTRGRRGGKRAQRSARGAPPTRAGPLDADEASAQPPAHYYPVTIENWGRTLTFEKAPSRVFLGYHPLAEIFVGLGLADRAIGRAGFEAALRKAPVLPEQAAALRRIPVLSQNNYPPSREQLLTVRPDFLLAYGVFDVGGKLQGSPGLATVEQLDAIGAKTYMATCPDAKNDPGGGYGLDTLAGTYRTILDIGKIFGVPERAQRRVAEMKAQIAAVRAKVASDPLKVFIYGGGTGPLHAVGSRSGLITEIVQSAGGDNVFADEGQFFETSLESVAARPADAFVIFADHTKAMMRLDATDQTRFLFGQFPNMPASKSRRVAVTDYTFTATGWRTAQTVEKIARQLHPGAFAPTSSAGGRRASRRGA